MLKAKGTKLPFEARVDFKTDTDGQDQIPINMRKKKKFWETIAKF